MNKWDQRYKDATTPGEPSYALREFHYLLPQSGNALDIACGLGAGAFLLAQRGMNVTAWDNSNVAIEKLQQFAREKKLTINAQHRDVSAEPPPPARFDVIHVSHFLERGLCPAIAAALKPGGLLFYQTFCTEKVDTAHGPGNPDFLLQKNELLQLFDSLSVVVYHELGTLGATHAGLRDRALLIAQKPV
jgi:2-polyprenyl-3-methyl-5-hydroxy-6-metoxy-1,4-benzoquinol methylase